MLSEKEMDYYKNLSAMELFERLKTIMLRYPIMQVKPKDFVEQFRTFTTILAIFVSEYNAISAGLLPDHMKNDPNLSKEAGEWERLLG